MATPNQINYIKTLTEQLGERTTIIIKNKLGINKDPMEMSVTEAHIVISAMKKEEKLTR